MSHEHPPAKYSTGMDLELTEKCVLLIGAGRGLGGAAALAIAREGARVAVVARTRADVEARASECEAAGARKALAIAADATDAAQLDTAIEESASKLGALDAVVTLVGGSQPGRTAELAHADWRYAHEPKPRPRVRRTRPPAPHLANSAAQRRLPPAYRGASVSVHVAS